jgi:hypothetical protein
MGRQFFLLLTLLFIWQGNFKSGFNFRSVSSVDPIQSHQQNCWSIIDTFISRLPPIEKSEYISGEELRMKLANDMRNAGYNNTLDLINKHKDSVQGDSTILEIGPFLNPLSPSFGSKHHYVVWEYDRPALLKIKNDSSLKQDKVTALHVDLNVLEREDKWDEFILHNQDELTRIGAGTKFGAVVISSVFNYINYKLVLKKILPLMEDGAILFIANSNRGTKENYYNKRPVLATEILEYVLSEFPNQISFLESNKKIMTNVFDMKLSSIAVAFKIHKNQTVSAQDNYAKAIELHLDTFYEEHSFIPSRRAWWDIMDSEGKLRFKSALVGNIPDAEELAEKRLQWSIAREDLKQVYYTQMKQAVEKLRTIPYDSPEWHVFKDSLMSPESQYQVIIERAIFLRALEIPNLGTRSLYLDQALNNLYSSLGHAN